jgi:hypothetical protein
MNVVYMGIINGFLAALIANMFGLNITQRKWWVVVIIINTAFSISGNW